MKRRFCITRLASTASWTESRKPWMPCAKHGKQVPRMQCGRGAIRTSFCCTAIPSSSAYTRNHLPHRLSRSCRTLPHLPLAPFSLRSVLHPRHKSRGTAIPLRNINTYLTFRDESIKDNFRIADNPELPPRIGSPNGSLLRKRMFRQSGLLPILREPRRKWLQAPEKVRRRDFYGV